MRQRAIEALRYRAHPEGTKVLARAASHDPDPEVRLSALVALSSRDDPSLRELVRTIAANDPSPVVREQAARMLEG